MKRMILAFILIASDVVLGAYELTYKYPLELKHANGVIKFIIDITGRGDPPQFTVVNYFRFEGWIGDNHWYSFARSEKEILDVIVKAGRLADGQAIEGAGVIKAIRKGRNIHLKIHREEGDAPDVIEIIVTVPIAVQFSKQVRWARKTEPVSKLWP